LLTGCGKSASSASGPESSATFGALTESTSESDACSLLEPREVEAVLRSALGTPPFLSRDGRPESDGSDCQYEDANLHHITVGVEWDHGAMLFKMLGGFQNAVDQHAKGLLHIAEGADIAGEWDEARVVGCCRLAALRGDQLVTVDVEGSRGTIADAATLANAALKRLDKPLPGTGWRNVKPALTFEAAHRPRPREACALASRAEVETAVGPLTAEPVAGEDRCEYQGTQQGTERGAFAPVYVLTVRWIGGFGEFRQHNATFGSMTQGLSHSMGLSGEMKDAFESTGVGADMASNPAWDMAHYDISGLSAVKKDVLVTIEPQGGSAESAVKLMERVMSKL
jgi:hypothetical protein